MNGTDVPFGAGGVVEIGMIGLGRMGGDMSRRLRAAGHECIVYDQDHAAVEALEPYGAQGVASLEEMARALSAPRVVWMMLPAGAVGDVVDRLTDVLSAGDMIVDGGNSHYRDAIGRSRRLAERDIDYVDVGVSGGVWGRDGGYCLMAGGSEAAFDRIVPVLADLAPGIEAAPRQRQGVPTGAEQGFLHCGPSGAGHFVKMIHNGIEYATMAAYAEGLAILAGAGVGNLEPVIDAETAPLRDRGAYGYDLDIADIAELWRRGSVVRSWLLDLTAAALHADSDLGDLSGRVADSGEGRWAAQTAIDLGIPAPVISAALYERFTSRGNGEYAMKLLSAMRSAFGGHDELGA